MLPAHEQAVATINETLPFYMKQFETCKKYLAAFDALKSTPIYTQNGEWPEDLKQLLTINTVSAEFTIVLGDLAVVCKSCLSAEYEWEKLYFLRQSYLVLYESLLVYGRHRRFLMDAAKASNKQEDFLSLAAKIKAFKKDIDFEDTLRNTRNQIAGHIEDFESYAALVAGVSSDTVLMMLLQLLNIFRQLQQLLLVLLVHQNGRLTAKVEALEVKATGLTAQLEEMLQNSTK